LVKNDNVIDANILPKNHNFGGHQNFFGADTTRKCVPVKSKNNAQTILKQLPNNFEKSQIWGKKSPSPAHCRLFQ